MAKTPSIDVPEYLPRFAVRLLKTVRSSAGQEFQAGQTAGFSAESAGYLVSIGAAVWPDASTAAPVAVKEEAPETPPGFAPVSYSPVAHGESPDETGRVEAKAPTESRPVEPRRKRY